MLAKLKAILKLIAWSISVALVVSIIIGLLQIIIPALLIAFIFMCIEAIVTMDVKSIDSKKKE